MWQKLGNQLKILKPVCLTCTCPIVVLLGDLHCRNLLRCYLQLTVTSSEGPGCETMDGSQVIASDRCLKTQNQGPHSQVHSVSHDKCFWSKDLFQIMSTKKMRYYTGQDDTSIVWVVGSVSITAQMAEEAEARPIEATSASCLFCWAVDAIAGSHFAKKLQCTGLLQSVLEMFHIS